MHCGFIALVGRPNVGKSTLLNALVGHELSIVTPRPETTRDKIIAVVTRPDSQLVFVDTPGIHKAHGRLGDRMNRESISAIGDADVVVMVADASEGPGGFERDRIVLDALERVHKPSFLALNKVDLLKNKNNMLPLLQSYTSAKEWNAVIPISAASLDGVDRLLDACATQLPEGPALFPEDSLTDRPERFLAAERIREAVIHETSAEVPYVSAVELESFEEGDPVTRISATIHVERPGQKKILIGTKGAQIKAIGVRARKAIESMLGRKVMLELWVKVSPDWTKSDQSLERLGYGHASHASKK
jgi:GTP-binding protein Era